MRLVCGLSTVLIALALAACGPVGDAHRAMRAALVDPGSAIFSQEHTIAGGAVCGLVNSKNRLGGFTGSEPYKYDRVLGVSAVQRHPT